MSGGSRSEVCIVGAGPAGLQWALLMRDARVPYIVFEKADAAGSFFRVFPRGRRLISHNKIRVGQGFSSEFALRHDWHSLLGADSLMGERTAAYYPLADEYVEYLASISASLRIEYGTRVERVEYGAERSVVRTATSSSGGGGARGAWDCRHVVLATGLAPLPLPPEWASPASVSYSYADFPSPDAKSGTHPFCDNQPVAVIGAGNSAFETAELLATCASAVHLLARSAPRFAALSHCMLSAGVERMPLASPISADAFHAPSLSRHLTPTLSPDETLTDPGHVRFRNLGLIDRYLLKSLDSYNHFLRPAQEAVDMLHTDRAKEAMRNLIVHQVRQHFANVTVWCGGWSGAQPGVVEGMDSTTRGKYPTLAPFYAVPAHPRNAWYAGSICTAPSILLHPI